MDADPTIALLRAEIRALHTALTALLRETTILRQERDAVMRAIGHKGGSPTRKKSKAH